MPDIGKTPGTSLRVLPANSPAARRLDEVRADPSPVPTLVDRAIAGVAEGLDPHALALRERIVDALKTVYDPELPVNLYDLGLIYRIDLKPADSPADAFDADLDMTLTAPGCPVAGTLPGEVERAVRGVAGVASAKVTLVWEPRWDKSRMSEEALLELGLL